MTEKVTVRRNTCFELLTTHNWGPGDIPKCLLDTSVWIFEQITFLKLSHKEMQVQNGTATNS